MKPTATDRLDFQLDTYFVVSVSKLMRGQTPLNYMIRGIDALFIYIWVLEYQYQYMFIIFDVCLFDIYDFFLDRETGPELYL